MRKIYAHLLLVQALFLLAIPTFAQSQEAMTVLSEAKCISSTQLESLTNVTFSDSQILIHLIDGSIVKHDFTDFENIIFGEYIPSVGIHEVNSDNTEFNVYLSEDKILTVEYSAVIKSLKLVELTGKSINVSLAGSESNVVEVSVESLTSGLYVVLTETENGLKTGKIIIK